MKYAFSLIFIYILCFHLGAQVKEDDPNYSPYTVINNFNSYLKQDNYDPEKAGRSFPKSDTIDREQTAIKLKKILDGKGIVLDYKNVPNDPDYIDSTSHQNTYQLLPSEKRIYLEKTGDNWYFSRETIQEIPAMYDEVYMFNVQPSKYLKGKIWTKSVFGITLATWLALALLILFCVIGFFIIKAIVNWLLNLYAQRRLEYNANLKSYIQKMSWIFALYIVCVLFVRYLPSIQLPLSWNAFLIKLVGISSVIFFVVFFNRLIDAIAYILKNKYNFSDRLNDQVIPITQRIIKMIVWVFGIFYILYYYLNVDPTALLAGLSIGGLALALAAQDTVKNFLGSAIILIDKPFQVNDWVQFNGEEGIVEEIGMRSTRIRSFEDSIIYVPNSLISSDVLNNKGLRNFRRFRMKLGIVYSTPPETIDKFVDGLVEIVKKHPDTVKYNYEVHLNDLSDSAILVLVNCFFSVQDGSSELRARHVLISDILKLAKSMNVQFAFPSQSLYVESWPNEPKPSVKKETPPKEKPQ